MTVRLRRKRATTWFTVPHKEEMIEAVRKALDVNAEDAGEAD